MKTTSLSALIALIGCTGLHVDPVLASPVSHSETTLSEVTTQDYYSLLRTRWASYYLGDPSLTFDAQLNAEVQAVNRVAKAWLNDLSISQTGLWSDIALENDTAEQRRNLGKQLYATYQRLFTLARAYKLQGGELENDPALRDSLIEALSFLHDHYYHVGTAEWGNWWHWQLGIGRVVNNILVILYDELPQEVISNYVEASRYFVPRATHLSEGYGAPYSSAPLMFESTGGNRTDNAQVVLIRGILDNNESEIKSAVEALSSIIPFVTEGDGFYKDGSFIQHKDLPYSGTYGQVMVQGLGMLMGLVANTPWQASDPNLQKIYPLLLEGFAPLLVNGNMMDMVNGRAISRANEQSQRVGQAMLSSMLLYLPGAPDAYRNQLAEFLKGQLLTSKEGLGRPTILSSYQLAQQLLSDGQINSATTRVSHKQFADMDRVVHHRPTWSFGIAMHSDRVGNYECINGENLKGWHTADGMTYLYSQGSEHYVNFWPLVDAYKLPGTTSLQTPRELCSGQLSAQRDGRQGSMDWTGGTSLNQYGVVGMKFVNWNQDLKAKKSWFMFDDEIIALGSDIRNSSKADAVTTLVNQRIDNGEKIVVNDRELTMDEAVQQPLKSLQIMRANQQPTIQYLSLDQQPIEVATRCREGNWSEIGTSKGELQGCFVEATLTHDSNDSGHYAYAILPNKTLASTAELPITVVENSADVHAVEHQELGLFAANFWDDSQAGIVTADNAMAIMLREQAETIEVSLSNPTRGWWNRNFSLAGQYTLLEDKEQRVALSDGNSFSVDLSGLEGASYTFRIQRNSIAEDK